MRSVACVILAAGKSSRMKSHRSKVMHRIAGREVLAYPIEAARACGATKIIVVRGPDQTDIEAFLKARGVAQVVQQQALGTAHAVLAARASLSAFSGDLLILCGDVPLVQAETLTAFVAAVRDQKAKLGVLTMAPPDPAPYGRIVRDLDGRILRIVESKDATDAERMIQEVNSGIICADRAWLFEALKKVGNANAKGEFYLTDLVGIALRESTPVTAHRCKCHEDLLGINTRVDLARAAELMRERINKRLALSGAGVMDYRHTYIDAGVRIGQDTLIMPFTFLEGDTSIGSGCTIENGVVLRSSKVGNGVHIKAYTVIEESSIADGAVVGPFARIRPASQVGKEARVGNFVELKKCVMKRGAKANHLTYLGDATVGASANIGCGTITCNYDGVAKHQTLIGDQVFVGSDTQFIAPVRVGKGAVIGAGSTITDDVPAGALALSRVKQDVVPGWARKRRAKKGSGKGT